MRKDSGLMDKRQPPKPSCIPQPIWKRIFQNTITPLELKILHKKPQKIQRTYEACRSCGTVYLCVLYGHPDIKVNDYLKRVSFERYALELATQAALLAERFDIFEALILHRNMDLKRAIEFQGFRLITVMAECDAVASLKYVLQRYPINSYTTEPVYCALCSACFKGSSSTIRYLLTVAPEYNESMMIENDFHALKYAIRYQPLSMVKQLVVLVLPRIEPLLTSQGLLLFKEAVASEKLSVLKYFLSLAPEKTHSILRANHYAIFREAVFYRGKKNIILFLLEMLPQEIEAMIVSDNYDAFHWSRSLSVLKFLVRQVPHQYPLMVQSDSYRSFRNAAREGDIRIMRWFFKILPGCKEDMVRSKDYEAFRNAASHKTPEVLRFLVEQLPMEAQAMVQICDYSAFCEAARFGRLDTMDYMVSLFPELIPDMVRAQNYKAFQDAASHGGLPTLKYLLSLAPDRTEEMICANDYKAFRQAMGSYTFKENLSETIEFFIKHAGNHVKDMVCSDNFSVFSEARNLETLQSLMQRVPEYQYDIIKAGDYAVF